MTEWFTERSAVPAVDRSGMSEDFLVYDYNGKIHIAFYDADELQWYEVNTGKVIDVEYWTVLPERPTKGSIVRNNLINTFLCLGMLLSPLIVYVIREVSK